METHDKKVRALKAKVRLELDDYVTDVAWTGDGSRVAAGTAAGSLYWIDVATQSILSQRSACMLGVASLAACPGSDLISTGDQEGKVKGWIPGSETPVFEIAAGKNWIEQMAWSPTPVYQEKHVLAFGEGKNLFFINEDGKEIRSRVELESSVSGLCWSPNSPQLMAACYGGLQVFGLRKSMPGAIQHHVWKGAFWCCAWSPDGKWTAGATQEKAVHIWEAKSGEHLHMPGYPVKVKSMGWMPDGKWLITSAGMDLVLWDCSGSGPLGREPKLLAAHGDQVSVCAIQHAGKLFASADEKGRMILWNFEQPVDEDIVAAFPGEAGFSAGVWSPDDKVLALGCADGGFLLF